MLLLFGFVPLLAKVLTFAFFIYIFAAELKNTPIMRDKLNIQLLTAAVLSLGGLVLLFCGIFIEPQGQIHESLLIGFGEVATFAGALFGIDYTYKYKHKN